MDRNIELGLNRLSNEALQKCTEQLSLKWFDKPYESEITFNKRLRTTGGRCFTSTGNIDINPLMLTEHDMDTLIGVVKHELCHYHLNNEGYIKEHHGKHFKALLNKVGGSRYAPSPKHPRKHYRRRHDYVYIYECEDCHNTFESSRNLNLDKWLCGVCKGRLLLEYSNRLDV